MLEINLIVCHTAVWTTDEASGRSKKIYNERLPAQPSICVSSAGTAAAARRRRPHAEREERCCRMRERERERERPGQKMATARKLWFRNPSKNEKAMAL